LPLQHELHGDAHTCINIQLSRLPRIPAPIPDCATYAPAKAIRHAVADFRGDLPTAWQKGQAKRAARAASPLPTRGFRPSAAGEGDEIVGSRRATEVRRLKRVSNFNRSPLPVPQRGRRRELL